VVAAAAARLGARFARHRVTVPSGPNLEARARAARFSVLPRGVATGHTMDDQAETILVNLLRGAGADGLAGMGPGFRHPLLGLRRCETHALCAAAGLVPACDPSNDDPAFVRNRVRHELLPLCAAVAGRDPVPVLARQAGVLRDEVALLESLAAEAVPDPSDARSVATASPPLARRALRRWLREAGGGGHPPSLAEVDRTLAVARGDAAGTELTGGRRVRRSRGRLRVERRGGSGSVTPVTDEGATGIPSWAEPDVGPVLVDAERLQVRVGELGAQITADYADDDPPLLVAVLKGAMLFMSDLCRAIELPVDVDFMAVSSYGSATKTSGVVRIVKDLDSELNDRHVLVVEDIIDSGLTLNYLRRYLTARQPRSVEICALLVKEGEQRVDLDLRYIGFTIPPEFVVGYGLDVAERYRNLAGVHRYLGPLS
jgi:hypoxanthine phosphoribosyltransferase